MQEAVTIIGAGLAGCEAALWLAGQGVRVTLYDQKPAGDALSKDIHPAYKTTALAELVCSNSLKAERLASAGGLLKAEMRLLGSRLLPVADACRVAAGGALAVDRNAFAAGVTALVEAEPNITLVREEVTALPRDGVTLVASGPLTQGPLAEDIAVQCAGAAENSTGSLLSFYDAAAPIVTADSLDMEKIFAASRYGRGDDDYLNCPFDKAGYEAFYTALTGAERAPLHDFDTPVTHYEGCMPVEVLAARGPDTLRYGPLKPVGLTDPRTGHRPWACVQLRAENAEGTLYNLVGFQTNLKFGEQKRVFGMIPGLENAEFARYGVMHRNTFLNSPAVLNGAFALKNAPQVFFAGQITGFEGYMESAACGLLAARSALRALRGETFVSPPRDTMTGALAAYIATPNKNFQPMGANMGLLPPLAEKIKGKQARYEQLAERALAALRAWEGL
ncbi:methylenetetrahydrofolate--tRNA-(uracil(54)-C(5))-methyltransferase (FADH(2)-oxidizing) TrmFO [Ruminococcaceae bacterium OttesenSCG-928-A11]|nr:methylenetetrahydrofolate--tRNA-(uracil(54)-C(5))-methyltransferase (FADH(2)-oxidizing) TrmFO [Ruminococcaceae bacterium OttesenSCG-928-A11]